MWWLEVAPDRLLAVFCDKSSEEPFKSANEHCRIQLKLSPSPIKSWTLEKSTDVGSKGWSQRMRSIKCCFEGLRHLQHYPFAVASISGLTGVGIGSNKESYQRAAALALTITAATMSGVQSPSLKAAAFNPLWGQGKLKGTAFTSLWGQGRLKAAAFN
jgi:hypothetical protein